MPILPNQQIELPLNAGGRNVKWIPGYEGKYAISDDGVITSYARGPRGVLLHPTINNDGYKKVQLSSPFKEFLVHILVLTTFKGPRPSNKHLALHTDDSKLNNRMENLEWGLHVRNMELAKLNKSFPVGTAHHKTTLTEDSVREIKRRYAEAGWNSTHTAKNVSHGSLAKEYGVSEATVRNIVTGKTWSHVL